MAKKEYIERDSIYSRVKTHTNPYGKPTLDYESGVKVLDMIKREPAADVVEVVRCKDCKHWRHETDGMIDHYECAVFCGCYGKGYLTGADDFCSYGERKEK